MTSQHVRASENAQVKGHKMDFDRGSWVHIHIHVCACAYVSVCIHLYVYVHKLETFQGTLCGKQARKCTCMCGQIDSATFDDAQLANTRGLRFAAWLRMVHDGRYARLRAWGQSTNDGKVGACNLCLLSSNFVSFLKVFLIQHHPRRYLCRKMGRRCQKIVLF